MSARRSEVSEPTEGRAWLSACDKARHLPSWSRHGWILADGAAGSGGVINASVGSSEVGEPTIAGGVARGIYR